MYNIVLFTHSISRIILDRVIMFKCVRLCVCMCVPPQPLKWYSLRITLYSLKCYLCKLKTGIDIHKHGVRNDDRWVTVYI